MKIQIYVTLLSLTCSYGAIAQTWFAPDYIWTYHVDFAMRTPSNMTMTVGQDTLLQGIFCKELVSSELYSPRYVYEDSNRVFAYRNGAFNKIYDMNLGPGDILVVPIWGNLNFTYRIEATDSVWVGTMFRRRQLARHMKFGKATNWLFEIIEGIGMASTLPGTCSFFFPDELFCFKNSDGWDLALSCFESKSGNYSTSNLCAVSTEQVNLTSSTITVSPNPVIDNIRFQYLETELFTGIQRLEFFDLSGRLVLERGNPDLAQAISIKHLPAGMYVYVLKTSAGNAVGKFVKH